MTAVPDPGPVPPGASGKTFASRTPLASLTALAAVAVSGAVAALRPEVRK